MRLHLSIGDTIEITPDGGAHAHFDEATGLLRCVADHAHPTDPPPAPVVQPPFPVPAGHLFAEAQDWWRNEAGRSGTDGKGPGDDFGHIHVGMVIEPFAVIRERRTVRVRSTMHRNPGRWRSLMVQAVPAGIVGSQRLGGDSTAVWYTRFDTPRTIANAAQTGGVRVDDVTAYWDDEIVIDPTTIAGSGQITLRIRQFVTQRSSSRNRTEDQRTSLYWPVIIENGFPEVQPEREWRNREIQGRGWYTRVIYAIGKLINPPTGPIRAGTTLQVACVKGTGKEPSADVTSHYIALDPDFHHDTGGRVLRQGDGPYTGPLTIPADVAVGWHRLFLRADAIDPETGTTNSGVLVVWLQVAE